MAEHAKSHAVTSSWGDAWKKAEGLTMEHCMEKVVPKLALKDV